MENTNAEKKGDAPIFDRRLKDIRICCWRNLAAETGRVWWHVTLSRNYRKGEQMHEAPGSLNGLPDIALAIAGLESVKQFIEQQPVE